MKIPNYNLDFIDARIYEFAKYIEKLLNEGLEPKEATIKAYEKYPIMDEMKQWLDREIVKIASLSYGKSLNQRQKKALRLPWAKDKLTLSKRTTNGKKAVIKTVATTIAKAIKEGENNKKLALKIFDGYKTKDNKIPKQDIPKYIKELTDLVQTTPPNKALKLDLRQIRRQIDRLSTENLKTAYKGIVDAVEKGNKLHLENTIYVATQERTRYFAHRIARTEMARAYHEGTLAKYNEDTDIVAFRWRTSTRHPKFDICDFYKEADLYGLGKGIYPKDKVPNLPAHPFCMCHLKPIVTGMLDNEVPKENIENGGKEYLNSLTKLRQEQLLGIHGRQKFLKGYTWKSLLRNYDNSHFTLRFIDKKIKYKMSPNLKKVLQNTMNEYRIKGTILDKPPKIKIDGYVFLDEHINLERKHGVKEKHIKPLFNNAEIILSRWDGISLIYLGRSGAVYLNTKHKVIATAYFRDDFDNDFKKLIKVVENYDNIK